LTRGSTNSFNLFVDGRIKSGQGGNEILAPSLFHQPTAGRGQPFRISFVSSSGMLSIG
jgi:hypothetical protein